MNASDAYRIVRDNFAAGVYTCPPVQPGKLNNGWCEDAACYVQELLGKQNVKWHSTDDFDLPGHVWIEWQGKHYDTDTLEGVADWRDLHIFKSFG